MIQKTYPLSRFVLLGGALALGGACMGPLDGSENEGELESSQEAIINGITLTTDSRGSAQFTAPAGGCSATVMRPNWVLTARHCVTTDGEPMGPVTTTPNILRAQLLNGRNTPAPHGVEVRAHWAYDAALVRLDAALLNASNQTMFNRLYPGDVSKLVNENVAVQGWGWNAITHCGTSEDDPDLGTGAGTLRIGSEYIYGASSDHLGTNPVLGRIAFHGDSGTSPWKLIGGQSRPVGVASYCHCTPSPLAVTDCGYVRGDVIRAWANAALGFAPAAGTPAGYERADAISTIVYPHNSTSHIRELSLTNNAWYLNDLNTISGSSIYASSEISAYVRADSVSALVFRGSDDHVRELALTTSGWVASDLSGSGRIVATGSRPSGYTRSDNVSVVVYRGSNNHLYELSRNADGTWSGYDLTALTGSPVISGDPIGYIRADGVNAVVAQVGTRVGEFALTGSGWVYYDLSLLTGATDANRNVAFGPRPYSRSDGVSAIVFVDALNRIQEMSLRNGSTWAIGSRPVTTGTATRVAIPFVRRDGTNSILYINSTDSKVRMASLTPQGWVTSNVSGSVGAPDALNPADRKGSLPSGYLRSDNEDTVIYQAADYHVIEISMKSTGWTFRDLTTASGGSL